MDVCENSTYSMVYAYLTRSFVNGHAVGVRLVEIFVASDLWKGEEILRLKIGERWFPTTPGCHDAFAIGDKKTYRFVNSEKKSSTSICYK